VALGTGLVVFGELAYSHPTALRMNNGLADIIHPAIAFLAVALAGLGVTTALPSSDSIDGLTRACAFVLLVVAVVAVVAGVLALFALATHNATLRSQLLAAAVASAWSWLLIASLPLIWPIRD
jgi:hypothetical protein